ncbi:DUF427 domain-containing protein [Oricola thermophila]|uniref:DUF427 domain-containing protein n=1 Tax=Oricola thermophila TaxID=2742145 RepID=A0A6N1VEG8_9HYPH|nr:DUF427 domain-containing protein [Oricola thermophila]QKV18005.1 DUF427 domain-containing protein [Oricola thermophila]
MARLTIHNPRNDAHFMRIMPVRARVRVRRGNALLAESDRAIRILETGRVVYDPVAHIPEADIIGPLEPVPNKSTHCPLKGDASWFSHHGEEIAWIYDRPLGIAMQSCGHVAFLAGKVTIEEIGEDTPLLAGRNECAGRWPYKRGRGNGVAPMRNGSTTGGSSRSSMRVSG